MAGPSFARRSQRALFTMPKQDGSPTDREMAIYRKVEVEGCIQRKVGQEYGISQPRCSQIVSSTRDWIASNFVMDIARERLKQTHRLECIYHHAMDKFQQSGKPVTEISVTRSLDAAGLSRRRFRKITKKHHDPRWLQVALNTLAEMRKIWAIDSPVTPDGQPNKEQIESRINILAQSLAITGSNVVVVAGDGNGSGGNGELPHHPNTEADGVS